MLETRGETLFREKLEERGLLSVRTAGGSVRISDLELVPICGEGESWISGGDLLMRVHEVGADFGQDQIEYILSRHEGIPEGWRILTPSFPNVVRRDRHGDLYFPFIYWNGEWNLEFCLLDSRHPSSGRLVRRRNRGRASS